jgi:hypothetical protein
MTHVSRALAAVALAAQTAHQVIDDVERYMLDTLHQDQRA